MSTIAGADVLVSEVKSQRAIQSSIEELVDELIASLPDPRQLTGEQRRGIIARYTAVLEGNFIYWMTATLLATKAEDARPIILENLHEETRDAHPHMMRKFAMAGRAFPNDRDALAVHEDLTNVRLFLGRLCGVQSLATMAFFEGFIQKFMPFLASLAAEQGSNEMEYTDVHGVCDIAHTAGLYQALWAEMAVEPLPEGADVLEGVYLLRDLIEQILRPEPAAA
ncbi:MAG: iron-containing redox enzyme family protein [Acidobacteriaceae bacterium]